MKGLTKHFSVLAQVHNYTDEKSFDFIKSGIMWFMEWVWKDSAEAAAKPTCNTGIVPYLWKRTIMFLFW